MRAAALPGTWKELIRCSRRLTHCNAGDVLESQSWERRRRHESWDRDCHYRGAAALWLQQLHWRTQSDGDQERGGEIGLVAGRCCAAKARGPDSESGGNGEGDRV